MTLRNLLVSIVCFSPGNWIVVDMGAGECSSLPPSLEPTSFYSRLAELTRNGPSEEAAVKGESNGS
jgi:hypothetical protein